MKSKSTISIVFTPGDIVVQASHDKTLLENALNAQIDISHSCGGNGTCGTCRVYVVAGLQHLPARNEIEEEMALDRGFAAEERLCCQNYPRPGLVLKIPNS